MGYHIDCDYTIQPDKNIDLKLDGIVADSPYIREARVVAYNESSIVLDTFDGGNYYPYATYVLQPDTIEKKQWLETKCKGLTKIE